MPADQQLDLRSVGKRAERPGRAEAERATGYVVGGSARSASVAGCRPWVDVSALEWDTVLVSAGRRGLQIEPRRRTIALTGATAGLGAPPKARGDHDVEADQHGALFPLDRRR